MRIRSADMVVVFKQTRVCSGLGCVRSGDEEEERFVGLKGERRGVVGEECWCDEIWGLYSSSKLGGTRQVGSKARKA
jgi:hypothetical protein